MNMIIPETQHVNPSKARKPVPPVALKAALVALAGGLTLTACNRQSQAPPPAVPEVATVTVTTQRVVLTTELPGRTSPFLIAEIRPQVSGLVQKRLFTEGSEVQAGQALYQIDPAPFQAALASAEAALGRAEANLPALRSRAARFKELVAERAVSQQNYDDAESALHQAEADVQYWKATAETARINLNYTKITSPISGRIGRSAMTDGAIVTAYQPLALAAVQQLDPIYVDVPQSTTELLRLRGWLTDGRLARDGANSSAVELILEDGTKYPEEGTLQFRDVTVDPTTATVTLRMVFSNTNRVLLPGMFVRTLVKEGVNEQAILIPQQSVSRDPKGNPLALILDAGGIVQPRMLTLDRAIGDQWLVTSGLSPGDRVIVEGLQKVRPGAPAKEATTETGGGENAPQGNAPHPAPKSN